MLKRIFLISMAVLIFVNAAEHSTYWHQRVSLFESLPNDKDEIIFLGNSITDGCEWSELFHDLRIKNRGISGDITRGVIDRLDEVLVSKPLQIFLMIGINDLARGISPDSILTNFEIIVRQIKTVSPETECLIQSLLPVNPDFGKFANHVNKANEIIEVNRKLQDFCQVENLTYIDLHSTFSIQENKLNPNFTNDGLHLTGKGYLKWKSMVERYIQ
ncbi:MAG: sialate O-acetylesterase [Candidatus Marinimicrobia bacterium]|nr:sialate O-acetylesterase [Candidatus Neomarinimicrobiota bacterium]